MSLYGEYGNIKTVKKHLEELSYEVKLCEYEGIYGEDTDLSEFDFIYVGSGVEKNIFEAVKRLSPLKDQLCEYISSGKCMLATGNAMSLFGEKIKIAESESNGLGIFTYSCEMYTDKRFFGDTLSSENNPFGANLIGVVNTSAVYSGIDTPLLENIYGAALGNNKKTASEGFVSNNFFATQYIGPFAVKNPHVLSKICSLATGDAIAVEESSNRALAYKRIVRALEERLIKDSGTKK